MRIVGYGDLVEVGRGGFGVIYRAHHQALDRIVAIKVLADTNLTEDQCQRFQREALAMAQLSWHPGIVTIYDTGITDTGQPYLAMEYLPNGSLGDQLRANGPLDPDTIIHHGTQLADALQAAHDNGILHRDIKPDNVLVDPLGQPRLTDFGIAALADHTRSATNLLTGSVGHTAPELLEGQPATTASDIYALGSTLFELAAGHPPFIRPDDDNLLAIALRTKTQPVPDLRPAGCPDTLANAIETAMAKDPHQRHPTPTDLANALTTTAASPTSVPSNSGRPRQRRLGNDPGSGWTAVDGSRHSASATAPKRTLARWLVASGAAVVLLGTGIGVFAGSATDDAPQSTGAPAVSSAGGSHLTYAAAVCPLVSGYLDLREQLGEELTNQGNSVDWDRFFRNVDQSADARRSVGDRLEAISPPAEFRSVHTALETDLALATSQVELLAAELSTYVLQDRGEFDFRQSQEWSDFVFNSDALVRRLDTTLADWVEVVLAGEIPGECESWLRGLGLP